MAVRQPYEGVKKLLVHHVSGLEVEMCGDGTRAWRPTKGMGIEQIWAIFRF